MRVGQIVTCICRATTFELDLVLPPHAHGLGPLYDLGLGSGTARRAIDKMRVRGYN